MSLVGVPSCKATMFDRKSWTLLPLLAALEHFLDSCLPFGLFYATQSAGMFFHSSIA